MATKACETTPATILHLDHQYKGVQILIKQGLRLAYLKPGALTSSGLFLDRHDLEHLIFQTRPQEKVNDLSLLHKN